MYTDEQMLKMLDESEDDSEGALKALTNKGLVQFTEIRQAVFAKASQLQCYQDDVNNCMFGSESY